MEPVSESPAQRIVRIWKDTCFEQTGNEFKFKTKQAFRSRIWKTYRWEVKTIIEDGAIIGSVGREIEGEVYFTQESFRISKDGTVDWAPSFLLQALR